MEDMVALVEHRGDGPKVPEGLDRPLNFVRRLQIVFGNGPGRTRRGYAAM
jgi:hypothetical protein